MFGRILLLFPPGWSFITGSPYLSNPILKGFVNKVAKQVTQIDLNNGYANYMQSHIITDEIENSLGSLGKMNSLYFREEDELNSLANKYKGSWNIQLGFSSNKYDSESSSSVLLGLSARSPFDNYYKEKIIPDIEKNVPSLISFSIVEQNQLIPALRLIYLLREKGYDGKILLGGNLITRIKSEIKKDWIFDLIDFIIIFQGETPFKRLIEELSSGKDFKSVPSLIWKEDKNIVESAQLKKNEQDPNNIPTPDFDGLNLESYWGVNYLPLVHFRGCYFGRCPFCPIPYSWGFGGFAGASSVLKLFNEMQDLYKKYGIFRFQLVDEAFTSHSAIELSKLIIQNGAPFEWMVYARFEKKWGNSGVTKLLRKGGLRKLHLGLEILNTKNRTAMGKKDYDININGIIDVLYNSGIKLHLFCLFGFPGTSIIDADLTMEYIISNKNKIDSVDINPYELYRNTTMDNITVLKHKEKDWAIRYDYIRHQDKLSNYDIESLTNEYEKILWQEDYKLLHPLYRIYSPWL
jgi:radical SAM superfamily enzyme YgiQ (UPF0313 family)